MWEYKIFSAVSVFFFLFYILFIVVMSRDRKLQDTLPYDTWLNVLTFLSPLILLTFEKVRYGLRSLAGRLTLSSPPKTCKEAQSLLENRTVWLSHLKNPEVDRFPRFPSFRPIHSLTVTELRKLVLEADRAFRIWTCHNAVRQTSERQVPLAQIKSIPSFVQPVPGEAYVIAYSIEVGLMCIDVEAGTCIWEGQPASLHLERRSSTDIYVASQMLSTGCLLICICMSDDLQRLCE